MHVQAEPSMAEILQVIDRLDKDVLTSFLSPLLQLLHMSAHTYIVVQPTMIDPTMQHIQAAASASASCVPFSL